MGYWSVGLHLSHKFGLLLQVGPSDLLPSENKKWKVKVGNSYKYNEDSGVLLTKSNGKEGEYGKEIGPENSDTVESWMPYLVLVVSISVLAVILLALSVFYCLYQRRNRVEEPKIDENIYYGKEEDYDELNT